MSRLQGLLFFYLVRGQELKEYFSRNFKGKLKKVENEKSLCLSLAKKSSGRVLLIYFLEVVLMFKSSAVPSLVKSIESVLKTDRLAVVSCVRISCSKGTSKNSG